MKIAEKKFSSFVLVVIIWVDTLDATEKVSHNFVFLYIGATDKNEATGVSNDDDKNVGANYSSRSLTNPWINGYIEPSPTRENIVKRDVNELTK